MINEINQKLIELNRTISQKTKILSRISETKKSIEDKQTEITLFHKQLLKEKKDLERIQKLSLYSIVASILGEKQEAETKEKNEYLDAKVKYDRLNYELVSLNDYLDINIIKNKEIIDLEDEYSKLLDKKKKLMIGISNDLKESINASTKKIYKLNKQEIEIKEAITAGDSSLYILKQLLRTLASAKSWGTWDLFTQKSLISSIIKHDKIAKANTQIIQMKQHYKRYKKELRDINMHIGNIDLEFSNTMKTFDIVFDNIFTDYAVQVKIKAALSEAHSINDDVEESLNSIKMLLPDVTKQLEIEQASLKEVIVNFK